VDAEGGRVSVVARRHGISDSLLYNWRSAWKAAALARTAAPTPVGFVRHRQVVGCWIAKAQWIAQRSATGVITSP
jgi:transposase-like protein